MFWCFWTEDTHMPASACRCSVRLSISRAPYVRGAIEPEPGSPGGPHRGDHVRRLSNRHVSPAPASISARTLAHMVAARAARSRHAAPSRARTRPSQRDNYSLRKHFASLRCVFIREIPTFQWQTGNNWSGHHSPLAYGAAHAWCLAHCYLEFAVVF